MSSVMVLLEFWGICLALGLVIWATFYFLCYRFKIFAPESIFQIAIVLLLGFFLTHSHLMFESKYRDEETLTVTRADLKDIRIETMDFGLGAGYVIGLAVGGIIIGYRCRRVQ